MGDIYRSISSVPSTPRRQFTLAGMLSFVLAVGMYCSMLTALRPLLSDDYWDYGQGRIWPIFVTIPTAWCLLWWLYRRWRLPQALRIHYAGPVIAVSLLAIGLCVGLFLELAVLSQSPPDVYSTVIKDGTNAFVVAFVAMVYACGISAAVSLPAATIMLVYLMLQPASDSRRPAPGLASSQQMRQAEATDESPSHE
jgi:hypothetical protein